MTWHLGKDTPSLLKLLVVCSMLVLVTSKDPSECREQEYRDKFGNCIACKQCDAGQELSKECGFGYGEDARCVPCRAGRFKEDRGLQKCKPCLDCALINRFQKGNCSASSNAACGDCLPGYYRKTKLSGFQDMECIPCSNPPPPYELHCNSRVNLVPLQTTVTSPRDMALAAVICSALASVLLALLILCVIYCKRQLLEKKPAALVQFQDGPYSGAELLCFDRRRVHEMPQWFRCDCHQGAGQTCRPVLIPSLCCEETCSRGRSRDASSFHSQEDLHEGPGNPLEGGVPAYFGSLPDPPSSDASEKWPHMQDLPCPAGLNLSHCDAEPSERGASLSGDEPPIPQAPEVQTDQSNSLTDSPLLPIQPLPSL